MNRILLVAFALAPLRGNPDAQPGLAPPRPDYPCFSATGTPAGSAISASLVPSRVQGVAPLAVFFDASGTTASAAARPFHDLAYCWDFGDTASGYFATTGGSRNRAHGPVAGHVFETPGNYTVTVRIRDSTGREASRTVAVAAQDPDSAFAGTRTVCFANGSDFAGCPAGARQEPGTSLLSSLQAHVGPGKRLLLRRGDSFAGSRLNLKSAGPALLGAYGTGARPRMLAGDAPVFSVTDPDTSVLFDDWRIVDIDVDGQGNPNSRFNEISVKSSNLLLLRCRAAKVGGGFTFTGLSVIDYWNNNGEPGQDVIDMFAVQESEAVDVVGGQGHNLVGGSGRRLVFLGNVFRNSTEGEHVMRTFWVDRGVLAHNDFGMAPAPRHLLKFHAPPFENAASIAYRKYTERVVIADNVFRGSGGHQWSVALGPQNGNSDERVRDLLVERNHFTPGPEVQVALVIWAQDVSVRGNVFDRGAGRDGILVEQRGLEPAPARIALLHNTCLGTGTATYLASLGSLGGPYPDIVGANNLIVGPGAAVGSSNSLSRFASLAGNLFFATPAAAGLASASPSEWPDFRLAAGSPAIDAGRPLSGFFPDFEGKSRGVLTDVGAFEFASGAPVLAGRGRTGREKPVLGARPKLKLHRSGHAYFDARGRLQP